MKKKIILLPGAGCSMNFYKDIMPLFNKNYNTEILVYDGNTFEENVESLLTKLLTIKEDFIVVSHCFSGLLTIKALSENNIPNLKRLVLCNSVCDFTELSRDFLSADNGEHNSDYIDYDIVLEAKKHLLPKDITEKQLEIALATDVTEHLKRIDIPVLVLCSDMDGYFPLELYHRTSSNIKNSTLAVVENARHLGLLTHANEYLHNISTWEKDVV